MKKDDLDRNSLNRIFNLLKIKGRCLEYHEEMILLVSKNSRFDAQVSLSTFFSSMSDVIDIFIVNFLNEEVSASHIEREPLAEIIENIKNMCNTSQDERHLAISVRDCKDLFRNRIDFYIGSNFLDFSVNTYSAFECWACKLYSRLKQEKGSRGSREKSIAKIIRKHLGLGQVESTLIERAAKEIFDDYVSYMSGAEKIDFIMSCVKNKYLRNFSSDKNVILFCRSIRNSIHNLGIHGGNSTSFESEGGGKILLSHGKPTFSEDYTINIALCNDLIEIYLAIVTAIGVSNIAINELIEFGASESQ